MIVYCTGYVECWPYVRDEVLRPTGEGDLFLNVFHKRYDNLFVAGLVRSAAGGYALFEDQGDVIGDAIRGNALQRARLHRLKTAPQRASRFGARYQKNDYQSSYLDAELYRNQLHELRRTLRRGHG